MTDFRLPDYLEHIRDAILEAQELLQGMDKAVFLTDRRTQLAMVALVGVIGEATGNALRRYPEFAESHSEVPWHKMRGLRDRVAHGYFDVDFEAIWVIMQRDLPALLEQLRTIEP